MEALLKVTGLTVTRSELVYSELPNPNQTLMKVSGRWTARPISVFSDRIKASTFRQTSRRLSSRILNTLARHKTNRMGRGLRFGATAATIMVTSAWASNRARDATSGTMEADTVVPGLTTRCLATVAFPGRMVAIFKETSRKASCMAMDSTSGKTDVAMKVNINTTKSTVMEPTYTLMEANIEASGKTACSTEWVG